MTKFLNCHLVVNLFNVIINETIILYLIQLYNKKVLFIQFLLDVIVYMLLVY